MGYENGRIPDSALAAISGGRLTAEAAASWNSMNCEARRRGVELLPAGPNSSYRTYAKQVEFWELYRRGGNPAARPGTSNHGWGKAIDLLNPATMRPVFDRIAPRYGWSQAEGARVGEAWHVTYMGGFRGSDPGPDGSRAVPREVTKANARQRKEEVRKIQAYLRRWAFLPPEWKVNESYSDEVRSAVWQFRAAVGLKGSSTVDEKTWLKLREDPYAHLTEGERRMVSEYDYLTRAEANPERRAVLVEQMIAKRKEIWRAAEGDARGWGALNRRARYQTLKARTEGAEPR